MNSIRINKLIAKGMAWDEAFKQVRSEFKESEMYPNLKWYELPAKRWAERDNEGWHIFRDSQRQKVYNSERQLRDYFADKNTKFYSIKEIDHYVGKLLKSAWFIRRWGKREKPTIIEIEGTTAWGWKMQNKMALPRWAWNKVVVLHELSHVIRVDNSGTSHGRYFCRTLLELIGHELGIEAGRCLKKRFVVRGIRSTPHPVYSEATKIKKKEIKTECVWMNYKP